MKLRNVHRVPREEPHGGTVLAWTLFTKEDFHSPVLFFNDNLVEPGKSIEPHEHSDIEEVYYILGGVGKIQVGSEEREVSEGDAIYIPPGELHSLANTGTHPLRFICLGVATPPTKD